MLSAIIKEKSPILSLAVKSYRLKAVPLKLKITADQEVAQVERFLVNYLDQKYAFSYLVKKLDSVYGFDSKYERIYSFC